MRIGKMNKIGQRVKMETQEARDQASKVIKGQTDDSVKELYLKLKDNSKVRWKESIKKVVGLPLATTAGLDQ